MVVVVAVINSSQTELHALNQEEDTTKVAVVEVIRVVGSSSTTVIVVAAVAGATTRAEANKEAAGAEDTSSSNNMAGVEVIMTHMVGLVAAEAATDLGHLQTAAAATTAISGSRALGHSKVEEVEEVVQDYRAAVQVDLKSDRPQWLLSCYGIDRGEECTLKGDVSPEEVRYRDVSEVRAGSRNPMQLQQELHQAVTAKAADLEELLR
eukprot:gene9437-9603_t